MDSQPNDQVDPQNAHQGKGEEEESCLPINPNIKLTQDSYFFDDLTTYFIANVINEECTLAKRVGVDQSIDTQVSENFTDPAFGKLTPEQQSAANFSSACLPIPVPIPLVCFYPNSSTFVSSNLTTNESISEETTSEQSTKSNTEVKSDSSN